VSVSVEKSWHTDREWFVRVSGSYRGEVMYYPASMRWQARPRRFGGHAQCQWFSDMADAVSFVAGA